MQDIIQQTMNRYTDFALTGDGIPEIKSFRYAPFENSTGVFPQSSRLILVLIESWILNNNADSPLTDELLYRLKRLKGDLRAEGLNSRFILADLYPGRHGSITNPVKKDGQVVLAVRKFFKDIKQSFVNFEGVILVGNFPEATLVGRTVWNQSECLKSTFEVAAARSDIVLSDLTGNWDTLYRPQFRPEDNISAFPDSDTIARGWHAEEGGGNSIESVLECEFTSTSPNFTFGRVNIAGLGDSFFDCFEINDSVCAIIGDPSTTLHLHLTPRSNNPEVSEDDRLLPNVIARPDIVISRLNAYHIARNPDPGLNFINADGNPATVAMRPIRDLNNNNQYYRLFTFPDFDLERELLIKYFDRNHVFRTGGFSNQPFRVGCVTGTDGISHTPSDYAGTLQNAADDFTASLNPPDPFTVHDPNKEASLLDYVRFLKTPAILKAIVAHSNGKYSHFGSTYTIAELASEVGGAPFRWKYEHGKYKPDFEGQANSADNYVHRALWHYNTLQQAGACFIIHGGCDVNTPIGEDDLFSYMKVPYTDLKYGVFQNAEGILFFTNCVALLSRSKGFNDFPDECVYGFKNSARANFGDCIKEYYKQLSNNEILAKHLIQRKKAYFWSINGDWTLRLRNKNGIGILGLDTSLKSVAIHPDNAWIDGWNFNTSHRIQGVGDIDGDGFTECVIKSRWGLAVIKYTGTGWSTITMAANNTDLGEWRYNSNMNSEQDRFLDIQPFTSDIHNAANEILIKSQHGLAVLRLSADHLTTTKFFLNGIRLGAWVLNTNSDKYCGSGNFSSIHYKDILLLSDWGIGIISVKHASHICMKSNGTRLGGWVLHARTDKVRLIADFDGDGYDEILISSSWGIGILKVYGASLMSIAMYENGTDLNGYVVNNADQFIIADRFSGNSRNQVIVTNANGMHLLELNTNLSRIAFCSEGGSIDGWAFTNSNIAIKSVGDINNDGRAEFLINDFSVTDSKIGIMCLNDANQFRCLTHAPYGSMLNHWHLQRSDIIAGSGKFIPGQNAKQLMIFKTWWGS